MTSRRAHLYISLILTAIGAAIAGAFLYARLALPPKAFAGIDVTGQIAVDFRLRDTEGRLRSLQDFAGKPLVVFFGFLNCPDACPTFLSLMNAVGSELEPGTFNVALVTVDPKRDSPSAMRDYLNAFDPAFVGLIPTSAELPALLAHFKSFAKSNPPNGDGYYTVDHTTYAFVFDGKGRLRLIMPHELSADNWIADLRALSSSVGGT